MTRRRATYHDANLILDLYELRRDEKMRDARDWFIHHFHVRTYDEFLARCPPGSDHHAYFRMLVSYWDMVASMIAAGLLEQTLFFRSGRELLFVWERIRHVVPAIRAAHADDRAWHNLDAVAQAFIAWLDEHGAGTYDRWAAGVATMKRDDE